MSSVGKLSHSLEWLGRRPLPCSVDSTGFVSVAYWENNTRDEAVIGLSIISLDCYQAKFCK